MDYAFFNITIKAFFCALVIYSLIIYFLFNNVISILSSPFNEMVKMIEINKQKIIMQSLFAESEINSPELIGKYNDSNSNQVYVYSRNGEQSLNDHEKSMKSVLVLAEKYTPIAFDNEVVNLLYRSYESNTYITTKEIKNFPESAFNAMNSEERCHKILICTKYASDVHLSDRVLVSPFYTDILTGNTIVTLSSPIYGELIVGDINADLNLTNYFSKDFELISEFQGEFKKNIIADKGIRIPNLTYSTSFFVDGNTSFSFKLSYGKIYTYHGWVFYVFFFLFYIIIYKWNEVKRKRIELKDVQQDSIKDALTGLYNRKIFDSEFFINRVRSNSGSIIAIDGNKIKFINDNYGHLVGDLAIQCIASKIKESFRTNDFLIRLGGDEFLIILPGCLIENALMLSKKLQQSIENSHFYHEKIELSVSCGVVFSESEECYEDAILRADQALYEQKNNRYNNE